MWTGLNATSNKTSFRDECGECSWIDRSWNELILSHVCLSLRVQTFAEKGVWNFKQTPKPNEFTPWKVWKGPCFFSVSPRKFSGIGRTGIFGSLPSFAFQIRYASWRGSCPFYFLSRLCKSLQHSQICIFIWLLASLQVFCDNVLPIGFSTTSTARGQACHLALCSRLTFLYPYERYSEHGSVCAKDLFLANNLSLKSCI